MRPLALALALLLAGCGPPGPCDYACQASRDQQNAIIGGMILGGYHPYRPAPSFVTCATGAQGTVNCIGQ